ncbi:MAG: LamG-like jellyroll fold domain-containing protein, partial [Roseibacillus sp.]
FLEAGDYPISFISRERGGGEHAEIFARADASSDFDPLSFGGFPGYLAETPLNISFYAKKNGWNGNWATHVSKRGEGGQGWQVRRRGSQNKEVFTTRGLGNDDPDQGTIESVPDGNWHHIMAQYDGSGGNRKLWIDGVLDYEVTSNGFINPAPGYNLVIGGRDNNANPGSNQAWIQALMDEVCIFHRTLSEAERLALVAGGAGVNTSVPGTYTVRYVSFDPHGNSNFTTREVIVDPNPALPVITLMGAADLTIEGSQDPFVDPGFDVVQGPGGAIPGDPLDANNVVVTGNTVDQTVPGIYRIFYNYTDAPNGTALEVVRIVRVVDTAGPVITLLGDNPMILQEGDEFFDPGATAVDIVAGNSGAYLESFPELSLIGRWSFDDPADRLKDDSGMGRNLALVGTSFFDDFEAPVPGGNFLDCSTGNNGAVVTGGAAANDLFEAGGDSLTVSSWVRGWPDGNWEPWVAKRGEGGQGWQLRRRGGETSAVLTTRGTGQDDNLATPVPQDGLWHHVLAVYDRSTNVKTIYVDGVAGTPANPTNGNNVNNATNHALTFSMRDNGGGNYGNWARVAVDDIQIYRRALTPDQITDLSDPNTGLDYIPNVLPPGVYTLSYTANDGNGNSTTVDRTLEVMGIPPPPPTFVSYSLNAALDSGSLVLANLMVGQTYHVTSSSDGENFTPVAGTQFEAAAEDEIRLVAADVLADPLLIYKVEEGVIPVPPVIFNIPVLIDFEADETGFVAQIFDPIDTDAPPAPTGTWLYGASGVGGSMGWSVAGGAAMYEDHLTSPLINVLGNGNVILEFDHLYNFEPAWDGGVVEMSVNGSGFTIVDDFTQHPYSVELQPELAGGADYGYVGDLNDVFVFSGPSGGFVHSVADLGNLSTGDELVIRFRGFWDWGFLQEPAPNWAIDNIGITQP